MSLFGAIGSTDLTPPPEIVSTLPERDDATDVTGPPPSVPPPARHDRAKSEELSVPRGEFDYGASTEIEQDKLRIAYEQSTLKRDASNALLNIAEAPATVVRPQPIGVLLHETAQHLRGDPTVLDAPETSKFERGDPTLGPGDPTMAGTSATGTLRSQAALRRKRGLGGDLRYVVTVLFGVRKARNELTELEAKQELRQQSRRRHLITMGRAAATLDGFDHPTLGPAREALVGVEDERGQHAAAVAAADGELQRVRRDRDAKAKEHADEIKALDVELADVAKKLEPLEKEAASIGKRAGDLKDLLRKHDIKLANTEMSQHSVAGNQNLATIQAELATLKADRIAIKREEPKLAAETDALNPRLAALEARRSDARKRRAEIEAAELEDQRRGEELLAAIGAKRKVVDRAASDAGTLRDKILFELGERLYHDRPKGLLAQLAPIDVIDVELGTGDRRTMELREILSSVDKAKLLRGIVVYVLIFAIASAIVLFAFDVF